MSDMDVEIILKAATVPGFKNVYAIGPFGNRVNFASQQRRALNLVWALEEVGEVLEGKAVAVIGGGACRNDGFDCNGCAQVRGASLRKMR
jgi:hypothetical protein